MKTLTLNQLKGILRARVDEAPSLRRLAPSLGMTASGISRLLVHADAKPGPTLLRALGYRKIEMYVKAPEKG